MKKRVQLFILFLFSVLGNSFAQTNDSTQVDSDQAVVYDFVIFNARFQNAFTFLGRDFGLDIPVLSNDMMYYFQGGVYVNLSALKFMEENLPWQYALSLGYATDLSEKTDINLSYSQFLVAGESAVAGIQNLAFLQGTFGWEWGPLYSSFQNQLLFNGDIDYFFATHHSRYFEFDQKLFKKITVAFEPKLSLMAGTNNFYLMGLYEIKPEELSEFNKFKFQSMEISLPVTLTRGMFEFEIFGRYVRPFNVPEFDFSRPRFIYGAQMSYSLPIKRTKKSKL
jgi:hypothetical protein